MRVSAAIAGSELTLGSCLVRMGSGLIHGIRLQGNTLRKACHGKSSRIVRSADSDW